jgi:heme-degrading monooxygenase HmoA
MTPKEAAAKVIVLFRTRLRADADLVAFGSLERRMSELVNEVPGYLGIKSYAAPDGDTISIAQFASRDALLAWRNHPEHVLAQRAGRERFYSAYDVRVCSVERAYEFALTHEQVA